MIASAYILPLTPRLAWWEAAATPNAALSTFDPTQPINPANYAARDRQLAYRDLLVASALARVSLAVGDIWGFGSPRARLAVSFSDAFIGATTPAPGAPVTYVNNASFPVDALATDNQLFSRDALVYEALYRAAETLVANPLAGTEPLVGQADTDVWALAGGISAPAGDVGNDLPLNPGLFAHPDAYLAWRDNVLAAYAVALTGNLANVYAVATRLLVQVTGSGVQEPEIYQLVSVSPTARVFAAAPWLPGQLALTYNPQVGTLSWSGQGILDAGDPLAPPALSFSALLGAQVTTIAALPGYLDAEFYRQKSSRLNTRPFKDAVLFSTAAPEGWAIGSAVYQPDSVFFPATGSQANFFIPATVPAGCDRLGLLVGVSNTLILQGFQNQQQAASGTAAPLPQGATLTWTVPLPMGQLFFSLAFHEANGLAAVFEVVVTVNGSEIFAGAIATSGPGVVQGNQIQATFVSGTAIFAVTCLQAVGGQLVIDELTIGTGAATGSTVSYALQASLTAGGLQAATVTSPTLALSGTVGRLDAVALDVLPSVDLLTPTLNLIFTTSSLVFLYLYAFDLRQFTAVTQLPAPSAYEGYKATLLRLALVAAQRAYQANTGQPELRTLQPDGSWRWDAAANQRFVAVLAAQQPRITQAFYPSGPGDVGRLALVPNGLQLISGDQVSAPNGWATGIPVLVTLQPWMVYFGALVAGPDFLPPTDTPCLANPPTLAADFTAVPLDNSYGSGPYIVTVQVASQTPTAPPGKSFIAITTTNLGAAGGIWRETVTYTATITQLVPGMTYTLVANYIVTNPANFASSPDTQSTVFVATATTQLVTATLTAFGFTTALYELTGWTVR